MTCPLGRSNRQNPSMEQAVSSKRLNVVVLATLNRTRQRQNDVRGPREKGQHAADGEPDIQERKCASHVRTCSMNRLIPILIFGIAACASSPVANVSIAPGLALVENLVGDRLYFGQSIPTGGFVSDSDWVAFSRDVITPRFPSGLTSWRADGQWLDPRGTLVHEPVYVIEIFHQRGSPSDSVFAWIASQYIQRFHQDAVLRTTFDVQSRFYSAPKPIGPTTDHR